MHPIPVICRLFRAWLSPRMRMSKRGRVSAPSRNEGGQPWSILPVLTCQ